MNFNMQKNDFFLRLAVFCMVILGLNPIVALCNSIVINGSTNVTWKSAAGITNKIPIAGTRVGFVGMPKTFTDENGKFQITLNSEDLRMVKYFIVDHSRYSTLIIPVDTTFFKKLDGKLDFDLIERNNSKLSESFYKNQNVIITGTVLDDKLKFIKGVNVRLSNFHYQSVSDENGNFRMHINKEYIASQSDLLFYFFKDGYSDEVIKVVDKRYSNQIINLSPTLQQDSSIQIISSGDILNLFQSMERKIEDANEKSSFLSEKFETDLKKQVAFRDLIMKEMSSLYDSIMTQKMIEKCKIDFSDSLNNLVRAYNLDALSYGKSKRFNVSIDYLFFRQDYESNILSSKSSSPMALNFGTYWGNYRRAYIGLFLCPVEFRKSFFLMPYFSYTFPTNIRRLYWQFGVGYSYFDKETFLGVQLPVYYDFKPLKSSTNFFSVGLKYIKLMQSSKNGFFIPESSFDYAGISLSYMFSFN